MDKDNVGSELTREKILSASLALFSKNGFKATSLSQICDKAEITKGALYWHFKNKRDLYFEMMRLIIDRIKQRFFDIMDSDSDSLTKIKRIFIEFMDLVENESDIKELFKLYLIDDQFLKSCEEEKQIWHWYDESNIVDLFEESIRNGYVSNELSAEQYSLALASMLEIMVYKWIQNSCNFPLKEWCMAYFKKFFESN